MNVHATAVVLADRGVLIAGRSGAGKTGLALALLAHARSAGRFARLVSDDQLLLRAASGRLVCEVPSAIAGLAELRGLGPRPVRHEPRVVVDLLVRLVEPAKAERYPDAAEETLAGCAVPLLRLAEGDRLAAVLAVASRLSLPPFG